MSSLILILNALITIVFVKKQRRTGYLSSNLMVMIMKLGVGLVNLLGSISIILKLVNGGKNNSSSTSLLVLKKTCIFGMT